jgi:hypothetical protein
MKWVLKTRTLERFRKSPSLRNHTQMVEIIDMHSAALRLIPRLIQVPRAGPCIIPLLDYRASGAPKQMQQKLDNGALPDAPSASLPQSGCSPASSCKHGSETPRI